MPESPPRVRPIADLLADQQLMTAALGRAVREALMQHAQAGQSVAIWHEGKVTWVPAKELLARLADGLAD